MGLVWASNVARKTNKPVLYLTPMAVGPQTIAEAAKFGVDAVLSREGSSKGHIVVTNYERLHYFSPADFSGVVCDESSILKNFAGTPRRDHDLHAQGAVPAAGTATAAPNDYIELGTSSEALGYMGHMDMLNRFFKNDLNNSSARPRIHGRSSSGASRGTPRYRSGAGSARGRARCAGRPTSASTTAPSSCRRWTRSSIWSRSTRLATGCCSRCRRRGLQEQREERRRDAAAERCEKARADGQQDGRAGAVWCHLNDEGDLLEKLIPDAVQVSGKDSDEAKEEKARLRGRPSRVLVTKPKIGAWGLNFQHCNHITFFPSHSFEQYYQKVRRCWRFGQKRPVRSTS
jgi:hypothetical protein